MVNCRMFLLNDNTFTGTIPNELLLKVLSPEIVHVNFLGSTSWNIIQLDLSNNRLSGTFPSYGNHGYNDTILAQQLQVIWDEAQDAAAGLQEHYAQPRYGSQLKLHGNQNLTGTLDPLFCINPYFNVNGSFPLSLNGFSANCAKDDNDDSSQSLLQCSCCTQCYRQQDGTYWERCLNENSDYCVKCGYNRTASSCLYCPEHYFFRDGLMLLDGDTDAAISYESVCNSRDCQWDYVTGSCVSRET